MKGIRRDLDKLYNTLNNPNRLHKDPDLPANWGKPWTPAASGYKGDDIPRELIAEAVRLYMANPSYLKDTAPAVAKAIRKAVNGNPELRKIIQFNSGGPPIPPANTRPQESTRPKEERRELYRLLDGHLVPYT